MDVPLQPCTNSCIDGRYESVVILARKAGQARKDLIGWSAEGHSEFRPVHSWSISRSIIGRTNDATKAGTSHV